MRAEEECVKREKEELGITEYAEGIQRPYDTSCCVVGANGMSRAERIAAYNPAFVMVAVPSPVASLTE